MNPLDAILVLLSLVFGALVVALNGLTVRGLGPAGLALFAALWQLYFQRLRHRSWQLHSDADFQPGTQHLAITASIGYGVLSLAAIGWAITTLPRL